MEKDFDSGWSANIGPSLSLIRGSGTPLFGTYLGISYNGHIKAHGSHAALSQSFELMFRKRSATLVPESKTSLNKIAAEYQKSSTQKNLHIFIEGDAFGKKTNKLTAPLFRKRVSNIKNYLIQQGVRDSSIVVRPNSQSSKNMNYRQMIVRVE